MVDLHGMRLTMGGGWVGVENSLSILDSQTTLVGDKYALTGKWLWSYSLLIILISLVLNFLDEALDEAQVLGCCSDGGQRHCCRGGGQRRCRHRNVGQQHKAFV